MIVIEGKAHHPVYLWIQDDSVEIREASHLWGKNDLGDARYSSGKISQDPTLHVLSIGPAGENIVRGACIIQDRARAFGRCGTGAVMGSKNLKAIVAKGTRAVKVADRDVFMEVVRKVREMFKTARGLDDMRKYGTLRLWRKSRRIRRQLQELSGNLVSEAMAEAIEPKKSIDKYMVARQKLPGMCHRVRAPSPHHRRPLRRARDGGESMGGCSDASGTARDRGADVHVQGECIVQPARSGCRCRRWSDRLGHGVLRERHSP